MSPRHSIEVFKHPDQLPVDAVPLFTAAERQHFQLGLPWLRNLIHTVYAGHDGICIYLLRGDGKVLAALPLLATKVAGGWQLESLSNYYTSLYAPACTPALQSRSLEYLLVAAIAAHRPVVSLRFSPMDPESTVYKALLQALWRSAVVPFRFYCYGNWYLKVTCGWDAYLKTRSATLRNTIKRMRKKWSADGGSVEVLQGGRDLQRGLAAYEHIYARSWKVPEPYPHFIPGLMAMASDQGALRLGLACLNEQPVSAQLWFVAHGKAFIYKVAYDEAFKAYAPGTLVMATLMEQVLDQEQVSEVDFLTGDDPYKANWMDHRRERWGIIAYNPKTLRGMLGLCREAAARAVRPLLLRFRKAGAKK